MPLCGTEEESARLVEQPHPIPGHWYISSPAPQAFVVTFVGTGRFQVGTGVSLSTICLFNGFQAIKLKPSIWRVIGREK
ncbi:hypothetical protein Celaphus_00004926 [Cervus elaphus hippelaphus]|uniref:Uncharacterized protein n=1 Tax=Cervus elaphus hippelaphus TaxID=46360 RepID=A0A212DDL9_CEREH|nr:hypothetical protein Celaphus_00004926 [Cervus elaphus hippelaphus]